MRPKVIRIPVARFSNALAEALDLAEDGSGKMIGGFVCWRQESTSDPDQVEIHYQWFDKTDSCLSVLGYLEYLKDAVLRYMHDDGEVTG
jgi:hypothetical protein